MRPLKSGSSNEFAAEELRSLEGAWPYRRAAKPYSDPDSCSAVQAPDAGNGHTLPIFLSMRSNF